MAAPWLSPATPRAARSARAASRPGPCRARRSPTPGSRPARRRPRRRSTSRNAARPTISTAKPARTNRSGRPARRRRAPGSTTPAVHVRVAAVSAMPGLRRADRPRQSTSARATYASTPKNANVRMPRSEDRGRQDRARRRASRAASGGAGRGAPRPPRRAEHDGQEPGWPLVRPASSSPARRRRRAPAAGARASGRRVVGRRAPPVGDTRGPAGRRCPARRDERQQPEEDVAPAEGLADRARRSPVRSRPGRTQAVESVANICGRSRSGRLRPIAT